MNFSEGKKNVLFLGAGLLIGASLGILLLFGTGILELPFSGGFREGSSVPAPVVGHPAPDFLLERLGDDPVSLSDYRGKIVFINFWATWCAPCELEMPFLQSRFERYSPDVVVLAVNYGEQPEDVAEFVHRLNLTFPVLLDPTAEIQRLYRVRGYPTTLVVDQEGIIQVYHIGILTEKQIDNYIKNLGVGG
jgi:cytochrome c biogenesis protein CcmG, thiol:disulfide interchange protein DsbE